MKPSAFVMKGGEFRFLNTSSSATTTTGNEVTLSEIMRIDSSGNLALGETSPNGKLHIKDGLTCSIDIENTSNTGLGEITFNDPDADDRGALQYSHNNDACLLYTSPSPRDGLLSRMPSSA